MATRTLLAAAAALTTLAFVAPAGAATLSDAYLVGTWSTGDAAACTDPATERSVFRADGTFATERNGKAVAVGFWTLRDDKLDMHVLANNNTIPELEPLDADYGYYVLHGLVFDVTDNSYRMVQSIGSHLQGVNAVRCP
ncbi:MAG: hypothetical protein U1E14_00460 [Geminicoccaceae bacterium]